MGHPLEPAEQAGTRLSAGMPLSRGRRLGWGLGLVGALLLTGCPLALTQAERDAMLTRYGEWQPRVLEYAPIAKAAYRDPEAPTLPERLVVAVQAFGSASKAYILLTDDSKRKHRIAIEGTTKDWRDFWIDAQAEPEPDPDLGIRTHPGFAAVAHAIYVDLMTNDRLKAGYTIGLTGHSLGGASALLLAMHLDRQGVTIDEVVTFGQPMATDAEGVRAYNRLTAKTLRVAACDDVIPFVPPAGYAPAGRVLLLLDPPRFEIESEELGRPYRQALVGEFENIMHKGTAFYGHRMEEYQKRLEDQRTAPWRYAELDPRYCSSK